jgi:hypothetical protein
MDLGEGEVFGEDYICFEQSNLYSIKVESNKVVLLSIERYELFKKYRKVIPHLRLYFK